MNIRQFTLVKEGKTNLYQMKDFINPAHNVTLNVAQNGKLVMSNTVVFARVEEVPDRDDLVVVTNTTSHYIYLSKDIMQNYVLEQIVKTANGYDHQYIFNYQL